MGSFTLTTLNRPYNLENHREEATQKLHKDLKTIAHSRWVQINDEHGDFEEIGLIKWIFERIKGVLGFVDHTKREILRFRLQQLLAQTVEKGLLTKEDCFGPKNLASLIEMGLNQGKVASKDAKEISDFVKNLLQKVVNPSENKTNLNDFVERYRVRHLEDLQPHALPWKIAHAWQKQTGPLDEEDDEEFTHWEFESSQDSQNLVTTIPNKTFQDEKKLSVSDFLEKISTLDDLRAELEKLTFPQEVNYKELYLHYLIANSLPRTDYDALVNEWISDTLSCNDQWSHQWLQKSNNFDGILQALDFKNSLSVLIAGYRLALLVKNQEEKQHNPSSQLINECLLAKEAFESRLKTWITSHQKEFENLNLSNFSPRELRFDKDSLSYHFLNLLSNRHRLQKENGKTYDWFLKGAKLISGGAILGAVGYTLKQLIDTPPPPPLPKATIFTSLSHEILGLGFAVTFMTIAGIAFHFLNKPQTTPPTKKIIKNKGSKRLNKIKDLLADATQFKCFNWMGDHYQPTDKITVRCGNSHKIIHTKPSQDGDLYTIKIQDKRIDPYNENHLGFFNKEGKDYLILNFVTESDILTCCVCLEEICDSDPISSIESIDFKKGLFEIKFQAANIHDESVSNDGLDEVIKKIQQSINLAQEKLADKSIELDEEQKEIVALLEELQNIKLSLEQIDSQNSVSLIAAAQEKIEDINNLILTSDRQMWEITPYRYYNELKVTYRHLMDEAPKVPEENERAAENLKDKLTEKFFKLSSQTTIEQLKKFEKWIHEHYLVEYQKLMPPQSEN